MRLPWQAEPEAGRSALAYYEAGLKRWRREMRLPVLLMVVVSAGIGVPLWKLAPHGEFYAGFVLGGGWAMILWVWDDPPEWIGRWKRGAEGETRTEKALRPLEKEGWRSYHDRSGRYGNLDHIAVGPGGVFLLDSKNLSGQVSLEPNGLRVTYGSGERDSYLLDSLERSMRGAAADLKKHIESATELRAWVQAVVVIWGDFPAGDAEGDRVAYVAGERLAAWIRRHSEALSLRNQRLVQLAIEAELLAPPVLAAHLIDRPNRERAAAD